MRHKALSDADAGGYRPCRFASSLVSQPRTACWPHAAAAQRLLTNNEQGGAEKTAPSAVSRPCAIELSVAERSSSYTGMLLSFSQS